MFVDWDCLFALALALVIKKHIEESESLDIVNKELQYKST